MNLILFGPPGAGKGTQAKYLVKKLNGFQISTGDMLRDEIRKDTEIGKKIINNMNEGKFVDDEIVNKLLERIIFDPQKKNKQKKRKILEKRSDDDADTILKRYDTYMDITKPVLEYYSKNKNFHEIDGSMEIINIYQKIEEILD